MTVDENKFCFIICVNDDLFFNECVQYIQWLEVPKGVEVELLEIRDAVSMTSGYNEGMRSSNAKYKVYMHQDVFIINRHFISDIISLFQFDSSIGMIGMVGSKKIPEHCMMWNGSRVVRGPQRVSWDDYRYKREDGFWVVEGIDGLLMVTQYDVPWREDLFDGWDFYDLSQSFEMRRRGYHIIVPVQNHIWFNHDDKTILSLWDYNKYRKIFMREYMGKNGGKECSKEL